MSVLVNLTNVIVLKGNLVTTPLALSKDSKCSYFCWFGYLKRASDHAYKGGLKSRESIKMLQMIVLWGKMVVFYNACCDRNTIRIAQVLKKRYWINSQSLTFCIIATTNNFLKDRKITKNYWLGFERKSMVLCKMISLAINGKSSDSKQELLICYVRTLAGKQTERECC